MSFLDQPVAADKDWQDPPLEKHLAGIVVRLADENIPIRAITRSLKIETDIVRDTIRNAIARGTITAMPRDDWHPGPKGVQPAEVRTQKMHDDDMTFNCIRRFKVTQVQAALLVLLLKRDEVTKAMLHQSIEHLRMTRSATVNYMEETDPKMVDVVICNMRKKLKLHGIKIETSWGRGYYISPDMRERAKKLIAEVSDVKKEAQI